MKRRKIAYIGASFKFVHQSVRDFLLFGGMDDTDLALYDIDPETLRIERDVIRRMIRQRKGGLTVTACKSRRQALEGADYVVVSVLVGGMGVAEREDQICQAHGIRHTVGDTVGPMCTARCLRMVPLLLDIAADMERFCPGAPMLSVTNPMAVLTNAVNRRTRIRCIGICHGTHFRQQQIAEAYGKKPIPDMEKFSSEHLHDIIFGLEGRFGDRIQRELHLNVTNGRAVPNLPADANLELTCHCGADGCRPVDNAPLPPFLLGILTPLVCANLLSEKAAAERDFAAFQEALTLDPLVSDFRSIPKLAKALWDVNVPYRKPAK
jgi:alpha-galactosidase/6-phospho-beta-glucosidase family protein